MLEISKILECEDCGAVIKALTKYECQELARNSYCDTCIRSRAKENGIKSAKYAIHPGWITSMVDGDSHYIGVGQLVRLYQLLPGEWIRWELEADKAGRDPEGYIHLYPRFDGNYGRPDRKNYR
jgi:hypothetical protein